MTFRPVYAIAPVFSFFFLCFVAFFIFVIIRMCRRLENPSDVTVIQDYSWNPAHPGMYPIPNPNYYNPYPQPYMPAHNIAQPVPGVVVSVHPDYGSVPGYGQYPR
ncbi:hypothetical protein RF11_02782 [Thelohanellus kitauei]|uniref:Uncharacterized protein n=1 Tax=Thelohanellus kitauei TaxID=669202 RepID=A0A0C2MH23_THEKT|nr:hypothetical protein RF11_02782 [Thelohanellus kitauei]